MLGRHHELVGIHQHTAGVVLYYLKRGDLDCMSQSEWEEDDGELIADLQAAWDLSLLGHSGHLD